MEGGVALLSWRFLRCRSTVIILAAVFTLGALRYAVNCQINPDDICHSVNRLSAFQGIITTDPEHRPNGVRAVLSVERINMRGTWHRASGSVMLNLYNCKKLDLKYGDRVRISTYAYTPREPSNPGEFSWKDYLARQGIYTCSSVRNTRQIRIVERNAGNYVLAVAFSAKQYISQSIAHIHPRKEASVITGMVLGTYAYLPRSTFSDFSRTGTLHILAASGFNCVIVLFIATFALRLLRIPVKWRWVGVISLLACYTLIVGAKPSLVRASVMVALVLLAAPLGRVANMRNILFCTGLIALAINPSDLFDVGFQLSYLAVWALITVTPVIRALIARYEVPDNASKVLLKPVWAKYIAAPAIATIAISLVTWPITAYYFNYISLTSIPANIVVASAAEVIFCEGMLSVVVAHLGFIGQAVGALGTLITHVMSDIVNALGSLRYSAISIPSPGALAIAGYYLALYAAASYWRAVFENK